MRLSPPLLLLLLSCGGSSMSNDADSGLEADANVDLELLDTNFPALSDVRGFSQVIAHEQDIHVVAYQRLRVTEEGSIDADFAWQSNSRPGIHGVDAMGRPYELQIDQGPKRWRLIVHDIEGRLDLASRYLVDLRAGGLGSC